MCGACLESFEARFARRCPAPQRRFPLRSPLRTARGGPESKMSYPVPAYKIDRYWVIYFARWKEHYSIYPSGRAVAARKQELAPYNLSKGKIRFPLDKPVPTGLITHIAK